MPEFGILKKSCVEVIQHRLLRNLQDADFVKSKDFPTLLPVLYSFIDFCTEKTEAKGPLLQHLKEEFIISLDENKFLCLSQISENCKLVKGRDKSLSEQISRREKATTNAFIRL